MSTISTSRGFTLIELIMVIILIGIMAGILAPVITQNINAYVDTHARSELTTRARISLERLVREIRRTIPNGIRVVGGGDTIEFITSSAGGRYIIPDDTMVPNTDCHKINERLVAGNSISDLCVLYSSALVLPTDGAVVIGNSSISWLDGYTDPGTWVELSSITPISGPLYMLNFTGAHAFPMASAGKHYSITDLSHEVGQNGNGIYWRSVSGINPGAGDLIDNSKQIDGTAGALLIDGVNSVTFDPSQLANGILGISLTLVDGDESLTIQDEFYVRNTP